jgi:hypothetical protein
MACSTTLSCVIIALSEQSLLAVLDGASAGYQRVDKVVMAISRLQVMRAINTQMACAKSTRSPRRVLYNCERSVPMLGWKVDAKRRQSTQTEARALLI